MDKVIYRVYSDEVDRRATIAYATGEPEDIKLYFADRGAYGLGLEEIKPVHVDWDTAREMDDLRKRKALLEKELAEVKDKLEKRVF